MRRTIAKRTIHRCRGRRHARYRKRRWARRTRRPHPGGAPRGNLNALRRGIHANPLSQTRLASLAAAIQETPCDLTTLLVPVIRDVQARAPDAFRALVALRVTLSKLTDAIADDLFHQELRQALCLLPPMLHDHFTARIEQLAAKQSPEERLALLRKTLRKRKQLWPQKQPTTQGSTAPRDTHRNESGLA